MNIFASLPTLLLFLAFFVPGFVGVKVYDISVATDDRNWAQSLFEVVGYSVLSYVISSPLIYLSYDQGWLYRGWSAWLCAVVVLLVLPAAYTLAFLRVIRLSFIRKHFIAPQKKPWDFVFGGRKPYWVILHLKSGKKVAGIYDEGSFTSSYPADEQIYLQELYDLDENDVFQDDPVERSAGALVSACDIEVVELFSYGSDGDATGGETSG